ncbi:hypothetical protein AC628_23625 [Bradyrhizobium sp. NAS96.2]|nr:hypothetical protein AC628_23625 [Bradyrhizobium sp. NAS96.2]
MMRSERLLWKPCKCEPLTQKLGYARTLRQCSKLGRGESELTRDCVDILMAQISQLGLSRQNSP